MDLQEQEKLYSQELLLIIQTAHLSECQDQNSFKNTSEKEHEWLENSSLWLASMPPASYSSIKSIQSEEPEWKDKEVTQKYNVLCFNFWINLTAFSPLKLLKSSWLLTV